MTNFPTVVHMQWSTSGEYLAVVGTRNNPVDNSSHLYIYSHDGSRLFGERIPGDEKVHQRLFFNRFE